MRAVAIKAAPPGKWPSMVDMYLKDGADVNTRDKGSNTIMMRAASMKPCYGESMAEVVKICLKKPDAKPNAQNFDGLTALHMLNGGVTDAITGAAMWEPSTNKGIQDTIEAILADPRTDPCAGDATPLMRAIAMKQHSATISKLLPSAARKGSIIWKEIAESMTDSGKDYKDKCQALAELLRRKWKELLPSEEQNALDNPIEGCILGSIEAKAIGKAEKERGFSSMPEETPTEKVAKEKERNAIIEAVKKNPIWSGVKKLELRNHLGIAEKHNDWLVTGVEGLGVRDWGPKFAKAIEPGNEVNLAERIEVVWKFLKQSLEYSKENKLEGDVKTITDYVWRASAGVNWHDGKLQKQCWKTHEDVMKDPFDKCKKYFEDKLNEQWVELEKADLDKNREKAEKPMIGKLTEGKAETCHVKDKELWHGRFWSGPLPDCFVWQNIETVAQELERVGAIESAEDLSKIMSEGMDPKEQLVQAFKPFTDESSPEFWLGLVILWLLAQINQVKDAFDEHMQEMADALKQEMADALNLQMADACEYLAAPVKKFERLMMKTKEYIVERGLTEWREIVYAPLCCIDQLRCSFVVDDKSKSKKEAVKQYLKLAEKIEHPKEVPAQGTGILGCARIKNGFCGEGEAPDGGYRDRKYNPIFTHKVNDKVGQVNLLVEIQLHFKSFKDVAKKQHFCYGASRGDYDKGGVQVGPPIQWDADMYGCKVVKLLNSRVCCNTKVYRANFELLAAQEEMEQQRQDWQRKKNMDDGEMFA